MSISLELRNLLDKEYYVAMANTAIYDQYDIGRSVSIGFKFNF